MGLDNKYFYYCEEIGLMKENTSHQEALDTIIKALKGTKQADPKFVEAVSALKLSSPEVSVRSCVLYRYDIPVDYVVGGNIKHTRITEYAQSTRVHDSLHLTEYSGNGEYKVLNSAAEIPYQLFNDGNVFTYDEMKNALKGVITNALPKSTTSYESKDWSISAYIVPVLTIIFTYKKKEYQMYYNLQNNYYHWEWAENPELLKRGTGAAVLSFFIKAACFIATVFSLLSAASTGNAIPILGCLAILIVQIIVASKTKKKKRAFQKIFLNNPEKGILAGLKTCIPMIILSVAAIVLTIVMAGMA